MTALQFMIIAVIEYGTMALIMCRVASESYKNHIKPILIYAPIYLTIVLLRFILFDPIVLAVIFASVVAFMLIAFSVKLKKAIIMSVVATFFFWIFIQTISVVVLGLYFSEPLEFTFANGLKSTILSLALAKFCYLFLPLERIIQNLTEPKRYIQYVAIFIVAIVFMHILLNSIYFESVYPFSAHSLILFTYFIVTAISSIVISLYYYGIKFFWRAKEKKFASEKFKFYEDFIVERGSDFFNCEKHFKIIHWLSRMYDDEKTDWYVDTHLDDFYDMKNEPLDGVATLPLIELPNKVLAAYLYVKIKHLRSLGIKSSVSNKYLFESLPKDTNIPNLLEALDILIDEVAAATDKERSNLNIVLKETAKMRMAIDICNNKHLLIEKEAQRMVNKGYSLKTREENALKKLRAISKKNEWTLSLTEGKRDNEEYLQLTYTL